MNSRPKTTPKGKKTGVSKKKKSQAKKSQATRLIMGALKIIIISMLIVSFAFAGILGGALYGYINTAEPISDSELDIKILTSFIYDSEGKEIAKLTGAENKNRELVYHDDTPKYLRDAFVAVEDERFYEHFGIDIRRIASAVLGVLSKGDTTHGGSTITQQVVKNITGKTEVSLKRKVQEWYNAIQLERRYEKWQILELYMNIIFMGHGCYGVQSASKLYFNKDVGDLSLAECALLAGITNAPALYDPFTKEGKENAIKRQKIILNLMLEQEKISQKEYDQALKEKLKFTKRDTSEAAVITQTYFVDQVINDVKNDLMEQKGMSEDMALRTIYNYGVKIYTTQDTKIQNIMDEVFTNDEYFYLDNAKAKEVDETPQAAMVIIDPYTGMVKAMYGGYGEKQGARTLNRATQAKRQPGSSIKPIAVYGPAIDLGLVTAATVIDDVPVYLDHQNPNQVYPRNYDTRVFDGLTTIRNAIKASVNVVAARVWKEYLGHENSMKYLKNLGIDRSEGVDANTVSVAMGGLANGVSPMEMASSYVPFVNRGVYFKPRTYTKVLDSDGKVLLENKPDSRIVYSEEAAFIMVDMMKEVTKGRNSTYPHSGTAVTNINIQDRKMPVAGKTGTTSDNIDKWFVGYTPYYVAATWYGYDNKIKPIKLESVEYAQAQKIWNAVMDKAHEGLEPKDFPVPDNLVKKNICIYSGKLATELCTHDPRGNATRVEYFIKGTEPKYNEFCDVHVKAAVCTGSQDIWGRDLLAGPYCPLGSIVEKVFIQRPPDMEYTPRNPDAAYPQDWKYELPKGEYCTVHGHPGSGFPGFGTGFEYDDENHDHINDTEPVTPPGRNEDEPPDPNNEFGEFSRN
ncbi:MAG: transglycosylase domain-containing protein [Acetivibrionales bacterium]